MTLAYRVAADGLYRQNHRVFIRNHPFNLKGVGATFYVVFVVAFFILLRGAAKKLFRDNLTLYFSTKTTFFRHKVLSEFFLPMSDSYTPPPPFKFADKNIFIQKFHSPPFPIQLNGRSLIIICRQT